MERISMRTDERVSMAARSARCVIADVCGRRGGEGGEGVGASQARAITCQIRLKI